VRNEDLGIYFGLLQTELVY